ncbi:TIGR03088 family PEP-CTERM/XrtA system glycosyltransferase [Zoogloea sp.]|uniref:TIGR03088 family PEP-CTERM/XrtA system glycosyltransferase n=1 Tax=Zoogloea sp. TaxID=49181 RepID=UPI001415B585|nr:MAG: TIGR03088 family PEP-CTERM/XrtA system glycosyltransferase [Zoogloea sp.]
MNDHRPLVIHVVFRFDVGGLENGIVNLINRMPADGYRHIILALTDCVPGFCSRIRRPDVEFLSLHKGEGHGIKLYPRLYRLFRELRPAIVHTRNLAALEAVVPAWFAGVPVRIHGEHGWDSFDPDGSVRKYQFLRRVYSPFVTAYIALSRRIENYLTDKVGIRAARVRRICNGVDAERFAPAAGRQPIEGSPFNDPTLFVFGAVGRLQAVKDHATLIRAFGEFLKLTPAARASARLIVVGGGPLRAELDALVLTLGLSDCVWLAGERSDIPVVNAGLDVFVQPSQAEGISNTLLEAMASGLPIIATDVGGNGELVVDGETGLLVPAIDPPRMGAAMAGLFNDRARVLEMGRKGRARVQAQFSLDAMVGAYLSFYGETLAAVAGQQGARSANVPSQK